jgi:hypothetical protein
MVSAISNNGRVHFMVYGENKKLFGLLKKIVFHSYHNIYLAVFFIDLKPLMEITGWVR